MQKLANNLPNELVLTRKTFKVLKLAILFNEDTQKFYQDTVIIEVVHNYSKIAESANEIIRLAFNES